MWNYIFKAIVVVEEAIEWTKIMTAHEKIEEMDKINLARQASGVSKTLTLTGFCIT